LRPPSAPELGAEPFRLFVHGARLAIAQPVTGAFFDQQRNVVLVGGTGTGKSHVAIGIARAVIRLGRKARFFNFVDPINR
jgi:DNA replication protein DnaC